MSRGPGPGKRAGTGPRPVLAAHIPNMSTKNAAQNRRRDPEGIPTGGRFATERRGETGLSTLGQPSDTIEWFASLAAAPMPPRAEEPHQVSPRDIADPLSSDRERNRGRLIRAREMAEEAERELTESPAEDSVERLGQEQKAVAARLSARHAAVIRAANHEDDYVELRDEIDDLQASDPEYAATVGLGGHPTDFTSRTTWATKTLEWARGHGMGQNTREVTQNEVARQLQAGTRVERADFTAHEPDTFTVHGHSDDQSSMYLIQDGKNPDRDGYTREQWGRACLVEDDQGNIFALDESTGAPRAIYRVLGGN